MAEPERDVVLWPTPENYPAFVAACDDEVPASYDEFYALSGPRFDELHRQGIDPELLDFDPIDMRRWCVTHFGKVNAEARAGYAAWLALEDERGREG